jgi:hypothetical protein
MGIYEKMILDYKPVLIKIINCCKANTKMEINFF